MGEITKLDAGVTSVPVRSMIHIWLKMSPLGLEEIVQTPASVGENRVPEVTVTVAPAIGPPPGGVSVIVGLGFTVKV